MHIGIDLDHTIIDYGNQFAERAFLLGYIDTNDKLTKDAVKKKIKELQNGENKWGMLQAEVYSQNICKAETMEGFSNFVYECRERQINLSIVSHKSKSNPHDPLNRDLKKPALDWMKSNKLFENRGLGFSLSEVFFAETVEDKLERIKALSCTHFVDDLFKVLTHPLFPVSTRKILFLKIPSDRKRKCLDYEGDWQMITTYLFPE